MSVRLVTVIAGQHIVVVHHDPATREFRARYRDAPPKRQDATDYFTSDKEDALTTGHAMAKRVSGWD